MSQAAVAPVPASGQASSSGDESAPLGLRDVIAAIPARCRERSTARGLGRVARTVAIYGLALTGLVFTDTWYLLVPLWLVAGLAVSGMFVLGHDAAHQALTDRRWLNATIGKVLMVPSQHIYESWVLGHNHIHHRHTARQGMDFVWHPVTPDEYRSWGRLRRLRHRVEWSWMGAGFYYLREVWWNKMIRLSEPPRKWADGIARDRRLLAGLTILTVGGVAAAGWLGYGSPLGALWLVTKLLVVPFLLFTWVIGFVVYVHHISPDLPWATRRGWTKVTGQLDSTTVLRINRLADYLFFHQIFVHVPHHVDPRIPCYHLTEAARHIAAAFPDRLIDRRLRLRNYLATTRACKLFDFDTGTWLTYRQARPAVADGA